MHAVCRSNVGSAVTQCSFPPLHHRQPLRQPWEPQIRTRDAPKAMEEQSKMVQHGRYLYCPSGSHMCMWDDQEVFMNGVIKFIKDVDGGKF